MFWKFNFATFVLCLVENIGLYPNTNIITKEKITMEKSLNKNDLALSSIKSGLAEKMVCTNEEWEKFIEFGYDYDKLPNDVYVQEVDGTTEYFRLKPVDIGDATLQKYLLSQQLNQAETISNMSDTLNTIKSCTVFFVIITIISLILGVIAMMNIMGNVLLY